MGNQLSTLTSIHDSLVEGNISLNNVNGNETLQAVDILIEVTESSLRKFDKLTTKEKKMMCTITNILGSASIHDVKDGSVLPAYVLTCRLKLLTVLNNLLSVGFIAKKEFENCFNGAIRRCLEFSEINILSLAVSCVISGTAALEDSYLALQICTRCQSIYPLMMTSAIKCLQLPEEPELVTSVSDDYYIMLRIFEHFSWILSQSNSTTNLKSAVSNMISSSATQNIATTVLSVMTTHLNTLSRIAVTDSASVSYAVCGLDFLLLKEKSPAHVRLVQDECRRNNLLLRLFVKIVQDIANIGNDTAKSGRQKENQVRRPLCLELDNARVPSVVGPWGVCAEYANQEIQLDMMKALLCALCIGSDDNTNFLLRSLPNGFRQLLSADVPVTKFVGWTESPSSNLTDLSGGTRDSITESSVTRQNSVDVQRLRSPQLLVTSMLLHTSDIMVNLSAPKGNSWHVIFDYLAMSSVETPLLYWNQGMFQILHDELMECLITYDRIASR
jgi:hypothetical protein